MIVRGEQIYRAAYLPSVTFDWWDKAQHALAFLMLGLLGLLSYPSFARRVFVGLVFYGVAIELVQDATGWRYGDWQDWGADVFGFGMAHLVVYPYQKWATRR